MTRDLSNEAISLAHQLRLGRSLEAVQNLPDLLGLVVNRSTSWKTERQAALPALINLMLKYQEREDWLGLADNLEYELIALLESR